MDNYGSITFHDDPINGQHNKITGFKLLTKRPEAFRLLEFEMDMPMIPNNLNVYKKDDIFISINLSSVSGRNITVDAFYFEEYAFDKQMELKSMGENGRTLKKPCFRFRVNPKEPGVWSFTVRMVVLGQQVDSLNGCIEVEDSCSVSRLAKVEPKRRQVFTTDANGPFVLIGENLAWNNHSEIKTQFGQNIANQMKFLSSYGCNYTRIWDYQDTGSRIKKAPHMMCQDSSAMWDYIFESAAKYGFYISFVLNPHGELSTSIDPSFDRSIWNKINGGYIDNAEDFFNDENCIGAFKTYVRYIVSRWGYSESILCWELFNEIDHTNAIAQGKINDVKKWLFEIATYIREIDPYGHMVSNSAGYPSVAFALTEPFDFIFFHLYNYLTLTQPMNLCYSCWRGNKKPIVIGETGIDGAAKIMLKKRIGYDLLELHQGNWSGLMSGSAGTGMHWYWEEVENNNGYRSFLPVSQMAKRIPWDDVKMVHVSNETISSSHHRINVMGYKGEGYAYLWFYDNNYLPTARDREVLFENQTACMELASGNYNISWFDTRTGDCIKEEMYICENNCMRLCLPDWSKDIAVGIVLKGD